MGSWPMKSKTKMHQMISEIQSPHWELLFGMGLKSLNCTQLFVHTGHSGGIIQNFFVSTFKVSVERYLFSGYEVVFCHWTKLFSRVENGNFTCKIDLTTCGVSWRSHFMYHSTLYCNSCFTRFINCQRSWSSYENINISRHCFLMFVR